MAARSPAAGRAPTFGAVAGPRARAGRRVGQQNAMNARGQGPPETNLATQIVVTAPAQQTFVMQEPYVPPVVITRVIEVRSHPHGGPPGQLKKQLGLKTGAQVVHGVAANPPMSSSTPVKVHGQGHKQTVVITQPVVIATPQQQKPEHGHGPDGNGPPGQQKDKGDKGGKGHGKKG